MISGLFFGNGIFRPEIRREKSGMNGSGFFFWVAQGAAHFLILQLISVQSVWPPDCFFEIRIRI